MHLNWDNFDQSVKDQKFHTVWILQNQSNFSVKYKNEAVQVGPDVARASNVLPAAIRFRLKESNQPQILGFYSIFIFQQQAINCGIMWNPHSAQSAAVTQSELSIDSPLLIVLLDYC